MWTRIAKNRVAQVSLLRPGAAGPSMSPFSSSVQDDLCSAVPTGLDRVIQFSRGLGRPFLSEPVIWTALMFCYPKGVEPTGSGAVAVRLPLLPFLLRSQNVCCCKHNVASRENITFPFGPPHAIRECVRANSKPKGREFGRQIQSGSTARNPKENVMKINPIAQSSLAVLVRRARPYPQLRCDPVAVDSALLYRSGRWLRLWWLNFRRP